MANKVLLKKSSVAAKVPLTTDLDYGEVALNYQDEKLYFKNSSNQVKHFKVTQETLTIGSGLSGTSYNGTTAVTINIDSTVVTLTGTQTLTNKTLTSPIMTTPTLGVASATSINKVVFTAPATSSTLTINDGKTLTVSNTLTFTGTDTSSVAFGTGGTVVYTANKLSVHAATTSAELAGVISDETGSGALVFGTSPAITTSLTTPSLSFDLINTTATTVNFAKAATTISIGATTGTTTINNGLVVTGDLTVSGTTTTINATTITVDDINIELGSVATPTDLTAAGGGITLKGATDKTISWSASNGWTSSEIFNIVSGKTYKINGTDVLSATTLGTGVTGSSLTSVGTITTGTWQGTAIAGQYGGTGVNNSGKTITLGGNLTTSGAFATTLTVTAATSVTLPTTGTLATLAGSEALTNKTVNGLTVTSTTGTLTVVSGGTLATAGAFSTTLTATAATNVTLPTTGTLATLAGSEALTNKTVNGLTITSTTGTLTLVNGSTLVTAGAFSTTLTATAATNVTLPTTGTLATLAGAESLTNKKLGSLTTNGIVTTSNSDGTLSVTATTGSGNVVLGTSPAISGGSITGLTSLAIRDTSAAFDVTLAATSSTVLTAGRTLTLDVVNAARTVKLAGNIDIANNFTTSGNFALTLTTTAATNVTLPTSGTLVNTAVTTLSSLVSVGTITTGTWNATDIALTAGGTNASLTAVNGGVVYSTASALAISAAGTSGQYLKSVGAGIPVWQTLTLEDLPDAWVKRSVVTSTTADLAAASATATTITGTLVAFPAQDGITLVVGNRLLVKNQTAPAQNGIYTLTTLGVAATTAWVLTRAADADTSSELASAQVAVDQGTLYGGTTWDTDFKSTDTLGTTAMAWNIIIDSGRLVTAGSTVTPAAVGYNGTTALAGQFDGGTTTPTGTTRLNYGGYFYPTFINLSGSGDTATAATHYFVETGTDGFVRPKTLANVQTEVVTNAVLFARNGAGAFGYTTGAGGAVTQLTSRATGVTLAEYSGAITLFSTTTTAGQVTTFTVTNSLVAATDVIIINHKSGGTIGAYIVYISTVAAGSFQVSVYTPVAQGTAAAPILQYAVVKAVNA